MHPQPPIYRLTALAAVTLALAWPAQSSAHGAAPPSDRVTPSDLPATPLKRSILDVQKKARTSGQDKTLVAEPVSQAVRAAERARGARAAGDKRNGALLDKLGQQWVNVASALLRAATREAAADASAKRLSALKVKVERAEALLAEQQARLGRLRADLRKLELAEKDKAASAADKEKKRIGVKTQAADTARKPNEKGGQ